MIQKFPVCLRKPRKFGMLPRKIDVGGLAVPREKHQQAIRAARLQTVPKEVGLLGSQTKVRALGEVLGCSWQLGVPGEIQYLAASIVFFSRSLVAPPQTLEVAVEILDRKS